MWLYIYLVRSIKYEMDVEKLNIISIYVCVRNGMKQKNINR